MNDPIRAHDHPKGLSDAQCTNLLGSQIAVLLGMADEEAVKGALIWWVENFFSAAEFFSKARRRK